MVEFVCVLLCPVDYADYRFCLISFKVLFNQFQFQTYKVVHDKRKGFLTPLILGHRAKFKVNFCLYCFRGSPTYSVHFVDHWNVVVLTVIRCSMTFHVLQNIDLYRFCLLSHWPHKISYDWLEYCHAYKGKFEQYYRVKSPSCHNVTYQVFNIFFGPSRDQCRVYISSIGNGCCVVKCRPTHLQIK